MAEIQSGHAAIAARMEGNLKQILGPWCKMRGTQAPGGKTRPVCPVTLRSLMDRSNGEDMDAKTWTH